MADIRRLCSGVVTANTQDSPYVVYTSPTNKKTIIKSIVVTNLSSSTEHTFSIALVGAAIAFRHVIKAGESLVLPAAGLVLQSNEQLAIGASNSVHIRIIGEVIDASSSGSPLVIQRANGLSTSQVGNTYLNASKDVLIKSVVFCNATASDATVNVTLGGNFIAFNKTIKAYDTLIIPFVDQLLVKGESANFWSNTASAIVAHVTGIEVT
ncbi:hypothetical protein YWY31_34910 [Paenibacillus illinoisensis]|uniref:hypothetical protein n=1 Tax=Paenibacillus illinoisensis TaxID=59845 RepID=UPI0034A97EFE